MMSLRTKHRIYSLIGGAMLLAVGCVSAPVQEMSDARQAIAAARDADAARRTPDLLNSAEQSMLDAQQQLKNYYYTNARQRAIAAKTLAAQARREALAQQRAEQQHGAQLAITAAQKAIAEAAALEGLWRDTESLLDSAKAAFEAGDYAKARAQAATAEEQAALAINQVYLEKARYLINAEKSRRRLPSSRRAAIRDAEAALLKHDGKQAYALINQLR